MPIYNYKAIRDGAEYQGRKEAADKISLYKEVKKEGGVIVSTKEESGTRFKINIFGGGVKLEQKINFAKNLATMLTAGISVNRALSIMEKQTKSKKFASVLESLAASIDRGKTLSEAMKDHKDTFSELFLMMVHAGEESGKMAESLRTVASQLERTNFLRKKIKGAMIYPTIVIIVMIILGILLLVYMVPTLTETFEGLGVALPLPTRIIIGLSDFVRSQFIALLAGTIVLVGAGGYFFKTDKGKRIWDWTVLRLPLISNIVKETNSARTARTLSSLVSSGVDIVAAIGVTKDVVQNSYYKKVLEEAAATIQKGESLSSVFIKAENLYPIFVGEMAAVGEETGELSPMFGNIADFYEGEVDEKTKNLSTIIEPLLMVLIGIGVGVFAISMLLPTYSLVDVIQ